MVYSLRTRSASKSEIEASKKAVANKSAIKKAAPAKKTAAIKKIEKKTETKKTEKNTVSKNVSDTKKAAEPKKAAAKLAAAKKVSVPNTDPAKVKAEAKKFPSKAVDDVEMKKAAPAKVAIKKVAKASSAKKSTSKASPAKKAATKAIPVKKAPLVKDAAVSKPATKKAARTPKNRLIRKIDAPIVNIEEISTPSLPEIELINQEEPEEKIIEIVVEGQVVNTHIRFSDDETEDVEMMNFSTEVIEDGEFHEKISVATSDFFSFDEFDEEEPIEEIEKEYPIINAHSAFEVFTSEEKPKTFNWNNSGSTYYQKIAEPVDEKPSEPAKIKLVDVEPADLAENKPVMSVEVSAPVVISNPFGFGFTSTNVSVTSRPNPFSLNSHFQSVSSPLDKLCNLTSKANPLPVTSSNFSFGTSSMGNSSFLPTSPASGFGKAVKSPSEKAEDKEERSPSVIQSIIIDDKHEDFSAF
jgi:hypothetical protein